MTRTRTCPGGSSKNPCPKGEKEEIKECQTNLCPIAENDTPCPSIECWDYDAESHCCHLKPNVCTKHVCEATRIDVTFSELLFGPRNTTEFEIEGIESSVEEQINNRIFKFNFSCELGECEMDHCIENDEIIFKIKLQPKDALSYVDPSTYLALGGESAGDQDESVNIWLSPVPYVPSVNFSCHYSTKVEIKSDESWTVSKRIISDEHHEQGDLAGGFALAMDSEKYTLGSRAQVSVTWAVTSLKDIRFHLTHCDLTEGDSVISLIYRDCYLATVNAKPGTDGTNTYQSFSYRTFAIKETTTWLVPDQLAVVETKQSLKCMIRLCQDLRPCPRNTVDFQCPQVGDMKYTISGSA